jgi:hypothetical protein
MGVTRKRVQEPFEKLNFMFAPSTEVHGQPRVMAQYDIAIIEIIGDTQDVSRAAVQLVVPPNDQQATFRGLLYWGVLMGVVAPDEKIAPWVVEQIKQAVIAVQLGADYAEETIVGTYNVSFSASPMEQGMMMTLTLSAE